MSANTPFNHILLRDHLFDLVIQPEGAPTRAATLGAGPFAQDEFDDFLRWIEVTPCAPSAQEKLLVMGREDWPDEDLHRWVTERDGGDSAKVYSQEMFLLFLLTGYDPYELDPDEFQALVEDHPAFRYLATLGFAWPGTEASPGNQNLAVEWTRVGLLRHMGYTVGQAGLPVRERQRILKDVFTTVLPHVNSAAYMAEWGAPHSAERLRKMAVSLASFYRTARRKANPPELAISDWEQDLGWLKERYYDGRFDFGWPSLLQP